MKGNSVLLFKKVTKGAITFTGLTISALNVSFEYFLKTDLSKTLSILYTVA